MNGIIRPLNYKKTNTHTHITAITTTKSRLSTVTSKETRKRKQSRETENVWCRTQGKVWVSLLRLSQKELCLIRGETSSVTSASGLQSLDSRLGEKTLLF